jgi:NTP pyrophosphatase (non-canonical NTP hydrolase)
MDIKAISQEIHENNKIKGFYDEPKNIGEMLMLIVTEVSEAMEADRKSKFYNKSLDYVSHNQGDFFESIFEQHCKNTFEDELADIVIRVMDMAIFKDIDLEWHILQKIRYNKTRPHKHGGKKC